LLESTGVAGHPEAYFRSPDEQSWADRWQVPGPGSPDWDPGAFVRAAIAAGSTPNGVFGAKLMWGTLEEVEDKFTLSPFGETRFVYLRREDAVAQAVSWLRAEQTTTWYIGDTNGNGKPPAYDGEAIAHWLRTIKEHNAAWLDWFAAAGVTPHCVRYEDLAVDMTGVTEGILDFLGLARPPGASITPRHQRQADALSLEWIARFRASRGFGAFRGTASAAGGE
jgi:LPS sulfotransferase NodH